LNQSEDLSSRVKQRNRSQRKRSKTSRRIKKLQGNEIEQFAEPSADIIRSQADGKEKKWDKPKDQKLQGNEKTKFA